MNQCQKYLYSVQLYIHITVLFSLIMNLFSVHLLICFVCMGRSGPASRLSQTHYIDFTQYTLQHTTQTSHFNTLHTSTLHTSTHYIDSTLQHNTHFNTDSGAVLLCKEMRAQLPRGPCCKKAHHNHFKKVDSVARMCLDIISSWCYCYSNSESVTRSRRMGAMKPNKVSTIQYVVFGGCPYIT